MMRFGGANQGSVSNSAEALEQLAKDKERREARALKFGVQTNDML